MNSDTQLLVKITYVESACNVLMRFAGTDEAVSTLEWMRNTSGELINTILRNGGKKALSWARVADRCKDRMCTLKEELPDVKPGTVDPSEEILHTISVLTHMLDDMSKVKHKAALIDDLLIAAYTLEEVLTLPKNRRKNEDDIRAYAGDFLEKLYKKMDEV